MLVIAGILQFIGVIIKNHFLIMPYILTSICRTVAISIFFYMSVVIAGSTHLPTALEFILFMTFGFFAVYGIIINIVLYRKLRAKYILEFRANKMAEPSMKYSELEVERDTETQTKLQIDKIKSKEKK